MKDKAEKYRVTELLSEKGIEFYKMDLEQYIICMRDIVELKVFRCRY